MRGIRLVELDGLDIDEGSLSQPDEVAKSDGAFDSNPDPHSSSKKVDQDVGLLSFDSVPFGLIRDRTADARRPVDAEQREQLLDVEAVRARGRGRAGLDSLQQEHERVIRGRQEEPAWAGQRSLDLAGATALAGAGAGVSI